MMKRMISCLLSICILTGAMHMQGGAAAAETQITGQNAAAAVQSEDASSVAALRKKTCADYGYEALKKEANGKNERAFYDRLVEAGENFWNFSEDLEMRENIVYGEMYIYDIIQLEEYGVSMEEAMSVYETFRNDNPLFYFASNNFLVYNIEDEEKQTAAGTPDSGMSTLAILLAYPDFAAAKVRKEYQEKLIPAYIAQFADCKKCETVYDKAKFIHDKIIATMDYAYQADGITPSETGVAHSLIGAVSGEGVCEAYAKTYQLLCNYYGIDNVYVVGAVKDDKNISFHSWNMVQFDDGLYYTVDCTADDLGDSADTKYYAVGLEQTAKLYYPFTREDEGADWLYDLPEEQSYQAFLQEKAVISGDINGDGKVSVSDCAALSRWLTDGTAKFAKTWKNGDLTGDGRLDANDLVLMKRMLLKESDSKSKK